MKKQVGFGSISYNIWQTLPSLDPLADVLSPGPFPPGRPRGAVPRAQAIVQAAPHVQAEVQAVPRIQADVKGVPDLEVLSVNRPKFLTPFSGDPLLQDDFWRAEHAFKKFPASAMPLPRSQTRSSPGNTVQVNPGSR